MCAGLLRVEGEILQQVDLAVKGHDGGLNLGLPGDLIQQSGQAFHALEFVDRGPASLYRHHQRDGFLRLCFVHVDLLLYTIVLNDEVGRLQAKYDLAGWIFHQRGYQDQVCLRAQRGWLLVRLSLGLRCGEADVNKEIRDESRLPHSTGPSDVFHR